MLSCFFVIKLPQVILWVFIGWFASNLSVGGKIWIFNCFRCLSSISTLWNSYRAAISRSMIFAVVIFVGGFCVTISFSWISSVARLYYIIVGCDLFFLLQIKWRHISFLWTLISKCSWSITVNKLGRLILTLLFLHLLDFLNILGHVRFCNLAVLVEALHHGGCSLTCWWSVIIVSLVVA